MFDQHAFVGFAVLAGVFSRITNTGLTFGWMPLRVLSQC